MNESELNTTAASRHPEGVRYSPLAFAMVSLLVIFVLYQLIGGGLSLLITGVTYTPDTVTVARAVTMAAQFIFLLLPTLWLLRRQHASVSAAAPWRMPGVAEIVLSVIGMAALLQAAEGYIYFQDMIPMPESIRPLVETVKKMIEETYRMLVSTSSPGELLWVLAVVALTPAICEEVLFRGLVQKNLTLATNERTGFWVTGIIFGLYHFNPFLVVPLMALGIYFSFLRSRSRSIILPMIAHFINNGISTVGVYLYGYDTAESSSLIPTDGTMLSVLSTTILSILVFILAVRMYGTVADRATAAAAEPVASEGAI